jgi:mxaJ protein
VIAARLLGLALVFAACGCRARHEGGPLRVERAEIRVLPSHAGALYLEIANDADVDDRLTGVDSPGVADAQLHETVRRGDVATMQEAPDGFRIPAGGALVLERGGSHAMLFGVEDGATHLPVTLHFARAAAVALDVPVRSAMQPAAPPPAARKLRVCADPNNLPFSDEHGAGFENKLADLVAGELHATVEYTWWPQRRGFFRNTLLAGKCDVVMGVPAALDMVATTRPYYTSGYVFVLGPHAPPIRSLDAPELRTMRIGVPMVGDDGANPPPVLALASRHLEGNLRGYSVYGDYRQESPPADVVRAVRAGEVDVAIAWGPLAGYYATRLGSPPLTVVPIPDAEAPAGSTFSFPIAIGVRHADHVLVTELDAVLRRRARDIVALLGAYGVPRL